MPYIKPVWTRRNTSRGGPIDRSESIFDDKRVRLVVHEHVHYPGSLFVTAHMDGKVFFEREQLVAKTLEAAEPEAELVFKIKLRDHVARVTGLLELL